MISSENVHQTGKLIMIIGELTFGMGVNAKIICFNVKKSKDPNLMEQR